MWHQCLLYGDTLTAVEHYVGSKHNGVPLLGTEYRSWNDLVPLAHNARTDHLVVFVCARRGTISFHNYLDRLPDQIERYFSSRNVLMVYPQQPFTRRS